MHLQQCYYIILPEIPTLSIKKNGGASPKGVQGHAPIRYVSLRFHSLHFEITVNGNSASKITTGSWSDAKSVKMAENHRRAAKKHAKKTG